MQARWFAYLSPTEPSLLEDTLITPANSLSHQVHDHYLPQLIPHNPSDLHDADHLTTARNSLYNIDGLGVAWYTTSYADFERGNTGHSSDGLETEGLWPAVYKAVQPPLNDLNFRSLCRNTETRCCFAHIRAASGTPIATVNNHPFLFGRHAFMHNGVVAGFSAIKRAVCGEMSEAAFGAINGGTDSEHLAALYMTYLTSGGDASTFSKTYGVREMEEAMRHTVATVIETQKRLLGSKAAPNSLNLCATDGIRLVAYRFRNHATEQPPSLYYSTKAGTTLNRKYPDHPDGIDIAGRFEGKDVEEHGKHLIVASEPSTYKAEDWELIGKNQCVLADPVSKVFERQQLLSLEAVRRSGGVILESGFDELFEQPNLDDEDDEKKANGIERAGLVLKPGYRDLGFVALIADRHSRRAKYMQALALGLPTLSGRWIADSLAAVNGPQAEATAPLAWSRYLLAAGESSYLNGAVRSRTIALTPSAGETKLVDTIEQRSKLLGGDGVLILASTKQKASWERRKTYAFLTLALGAGYVKRVSDYGEAKRLLGADGGEGWKWVYVDGSVGEASAALSGVGGVAAGASGKKRKRGGEATPNVEKNAMAAVSMDGRVKVINDEFVVQSLILGALVE
ncbi:hypothetical protein LTR54_001276 [Friedmanniomyces endolithicus]|nr:hypothetical protein LTR54_001276 [Friedmanniomyces endolithicus]